MRAVALIVLFAALAGLFCGGGKPAVPAATWPAEAIGSLTEADIAQFVKVLPTFSAALKAASWTPTLPKEDAGPVGSLVPYVEGMNVPGVEESLKAAGSDWSTLRPTLYKVFAATAALSVDAAPPEMIEQMRKDTSAAAKKGVKDYEAFKAACSQVPSANKQMVTSHQQELQALQTLGR